MFIIASVYVGLAVLIFATFVAEPFEVGIDMADDHLQAKQEAASDEGQQPANDDYTTVQVSESGPE